MPELTVRSITHDAPAVADYVAIRNAALPEDPESVESVRWAVATYPATFLLIASLGDRAVGCATTGRMYVHPPAYDRYWLMLCTLPDVRGRGVGSALLAAASAIARRDGKRGFHTIAYDTYPETLRFLEHRGFVETSRSRTVSLDLREAPQAAVSLPDGIRLVSMADRPDLVARLYDVALETFPDIPTGDEPVHPGTPEEFVADLTRPGSTLRATVAAVRGDDVLGYTHLRLVPGSSTVAWHEMTAVRPAWRGRGIATALKAASIAAAAREGIERLVTMNDETNAPMRAVNRRLGYQPAPDLIDLNGPLAD